MNPHIDITCSYSELEDSGRICEHIKSFLDFLATETNNEVEVCGLANPKAPDAYIFMKNRMTYDLVTKYVDASDYLKDERLKSGKVNRVFCSDPSHYSSEVVYDWRSKNDP